MKARRHQMRREEIHGETSQEANEGQRSIEMVAPDRSMEKAWKSVSVAV